MQHYQHTTDILIVGAGMAGLTAASELQQSGHDVLVIDKGRGVGGRLASRRIGLATFDHGAQFMTARNPRFAAAIEEWLKTGVIEEWYRTSAEGSAGHPRWRGNPTMTAVAKYLARNLNLLLEKRIVSLRRDPAGWVAALDSGEAVFARAVVLTPPIPQSIALLDFGELSLPPAMRARKRNTQSQDCSSIWRTGFSANLASLVP